MRALLLILTVLGSIVMSGCHDARMGGRGCTSDQTPMADSPAEQIGS